MPFHAIKCHVMFYVIKYCASMQCNTLQHKQYNAIQYNAMQYNTIQYNYNWRTHVVSTSPLTPDKLPCRNLINLKCLYRCSRRSLLSVLSIDFIFTNRIFFSFFLFGLSYSFFLRFFYHNTYICFPAYNFFAALIYEIAL